MAGRDRARLGDGDVARRNAVPLQSPLARAMRIVSLATEGSGSGHEMTKTRCERGADIALMLGFTEQTAEAIRHLDEHWDGGGMPSPTRIVTTGNGGASSGHGV